MEGTQLGPYLLLGELGTGGMGKVYRAEVVASAPGLAVGSHVALKIIHSHLLETAGFFQRFLREADIGRSVRHDNVVKTHLADALIHDGKQHNFLVMEYVKGQTLRALLRELQRIPEELCRHIGREVAKGLAAIHEAGVVHRDLKPENVLITADHVVKVMDLGVARLQDEAIRLSQAGAFVGSLEYAAPEQFRSTDGEPDGRADLHALGVMLYELSTGQHPYRDEDVSNVLHNILNGRARRAGSVNPQLSPFFEEMIHTLIATDREQRFPSASTLADVLTEGEKSEWWRARAQALRMESRRPLRRIRIPRETALYGRDDNLALLHARYDTAKLGEGQVLLIEGEAGIGKTRLVDEFVGRLREEGEDVNFLFGSYPPGGAATAAGAFSTAYRTQFGEEGLEATLQEYLSVTPALIPAFAALLQGEPPPRGEEPLTRESLQTLFVHASRKLAAERPTIVLIDDLHFAPEAGRALFASLTLGVPGHRLLLVGTMRPEMPETWTSNVTRLDHAAHLVLHRLGPKDLAGLLEDAFHSKRLANDLGWLIARKSDGNPFFAFEIIRGLREGKFIQEGADGTWVTTRVIENIQVPSSVSDLVQARIADLDDQERELLDVACCCGFQFHPALVADAIGVEIIPTLRRLAHLEARHRIVRSAGEHFVFDHHQVQESLHRALPELLARAYHASIAGALERLERVAGRDSRDIDGGLAVDICDHYLRGGQGARALPYLDAALQHLEQGYLNDQAVGLADSALAVEGLLAGTRRAEILLRKAARLDIAGRRAEQEAALDEASLLAGTHANRALRTRVDGALGAYYYAVSRWDEARALLEGTVDEAREIGDEAGAARALGSLGVVLSSQGHGEEALAQHERQLESSRAIGDLKQEVTASGNLGNVLHRLGRNKEARKHLEHSLALARKSGNRRHEAKSTLNLATVQWALGNYDEALLCNERCLEVFREIGDRSGEAHARGNLGLVARALGRFEEARDHHEEWLSIAREIGDRRGEAAALGSLGNVSWSLGLYGQAREHYEHWLAIAQEIGDRGGEATAIGNLGLISSALGHHEEAYQYYEKQAGIALEIGDLGGQSTAAGNLANVMADLGRLESAHESQSHCLSIARETGDRRGECIALVNRGNLLASLGAFDDAESELRASLSLSREIGAKDAEGHALLGLGHLAGCLGRTVEAREQVEAALSLFSAIDDSAGATDARIEIGRQHARAGENELARMAFTAARERTAEIVLLRADVMAGVHLAALGGDAETGLALFREYELRLGHAQRMEARFLLWQTTAEGEHLQEAKRLLDRLVEDAPAEFRVPMVENVRLHREIVRAWESHELA